MSKNKRYYQKQVETIAEVEKLDRKPKLLLHACCAPCSSTCLYILHNYFDVTIYYTNSNIYPSSEYERRFDELKSFLPKFNSDFNCSINLIEDLYDNQAFSKKICHLKDEPEGGKRCELCYAIRIKNALEFASKHGFEFVTTSLTLSRQKNSIKINQIAKELSKNYPTIVYFFSDFKKNGGIDLSLELTKQYDMYRQDYCGCIYSYQKRNLRKQNTSKKESLEI